MFVLERMRKVTMKTIIRLSMARSIVALMLGVAVLGALSASPGAVVVAQDKDKPTVSKAAAKPLKAAQEAMQAQKYDEALNKLSEVEALPKKSDYDDHLVQEMRGFIYVRQKNYTEAAKALEAGLSTGYLVPEDVAQRVKALAQVNYQIKNYDKAIEFGNRAVKEGYAD